MLVSVTYPGDGPGERLRDAGAGVPVSPRPCGAGAQALRDRKFPEAGPVRERSVVVFRLS